MSSISKINLSDTDYTLNASSISDYNSSTAKIQVGFAGAGLTASTLGYVAGYTTDGTKIKDVNKAQMKSWLGLGSAAYANLNTVFNRHLYPALGSTQTGNTPVWLLGLKGAGYPVYSDPEFASGTTVEKYANSGSENLTVTRGLATDFGIIDSGNSSGYVIQIKNTGTVVPGLGGFYLNPFSRANAIFIQIFRAMIPSGYSVQVASNPMGTSYQDTWLTSNAGTGKWEWYVRSIHCGSTGSFSSGGHVYLTGTTGTTDNPVIWYLSYCNCIDITKGNYDGLRTRFSDKLSTARNLKIGNTSKSFDGSSDVSWSLSEIGCLPLSGGTMSGDIKFNYNYGITLNTGTSWDDGYRTIPFSNVSDPSKIQWYSTNATTGLTFNAKSGTLKTGELITSGSTTSSKFIKSGGTSSQFLKADGSVDSNSYSTTSHTHTKSQITDFPASLKNPTSLTVKLNSGTTEGTNLFTYDGSAAKTVNITPSAIGAATSGHTHSTYFPYSGGTFTGPISFNTSSLPKFSGAPPFIVGIEAFADGGILKWADADAVKVGTATTSSYSSYLGNSSTNYSYSTLKSALDGKSSTSHTHNYATTVKIGTDTTSYTVSSNTITLPAYPTAASLGLSSAMKFIGTTTTALTDGATTNTITIGSTSVTATSGNVVLYGNKEFLWNGSTGKWEELGDESSHALKTVSIKAGTGLSGGGTLEADRTLSLNTAGTDTLGGVKTTSTVTSNSGYTACPIIGGIPYYKDTNTVYSLPTASSSTLGGIKTGYTTSGKNYKVQLDSNNNAYVNVPWTDTYTQYPYGFSSRLISSWGNQIGTIITDWRTASGGDVQWMNDNPVSGQVSLKVDGTVYINEGNDAVASQRWVNNKGYTTNTGTVTSVAVKMNGASKGTVTTSGTIDLGTVLTDDSTYFKQQRTSTKSIYDYVNDGTGDTFIASLPNGTYSIPYTFYDSSGNLQSSHSELLVRLALNAGSASALEFWTNYGNDSALKYRKTIDNNRISGAWKTIASTDYVDSSIKSHTHDDRYYTESETDNKLSAKQDKSTAVTHTASTAVGSSTKPVYIASDGTATAIGYTIAKSVPSNAVFTDTNTNQTIKGNGTGFGSTAAIDIVGSGATTVTADTTNNKITISSTNTTYTAGTNVTISGTTISAKDTVYSLPTASSSTLGGIKVGSNLSIDSNGVLSGTANTTYSAFKGASASAAGTSGLVPAPASGKNTSFLRGDGTWVVPTDTNTTYSAGDGLTLSGTKFSNSGVRSISTGTTNGTISVNTGGTTGNVAVKGLGSAAYTASSAYATASHTHSYLPLSGGTMTGKIYRNYASASAVPFIHIGANNVDATMLRVYSSDGTETSNYNSLYGYSLIYRGSGSGINNRLDLMADNQTSTQVTAISVNNQGDVGIKTTPTQNVPLTVNGSISATRLTRTGNGSFWYAGRTSALVRTTSVASDGWNVITSLKTKNGDWSTGVLGSTDKLEFCYTTDTDFNAGPDTNVTMHALSLDNAGNLTTNGSTTSSKFIKSGGTSSQFLKADGSVDSNSYSTTSHTHSYLPLSGGTITNSNFAPLSIQRSGSTYAAAIKFENSNGTLGYLGITGSANSSLKRWENDANTSHTICDDSNTYISSGTVYINGNSIKPVTSETSLSKGTTSGSGNAVTDISVSGHKITLTKDTTFLTAHQDISGKSNTSHTHSVKINGTTKTIAASGGTAVDLGTYLTAHQDISGKADKSTAVTHTASTAVGSSTQPVYIASDGKATAIGYTIAKSVPSNAVFTDTNTTYTAGAGLTLSGTSFSLNTAGSTLGGVKTTSTVTSNSGYTACPIIGGVPYYKDTTYDLSGYATQTWVNNKGYTTNTGTVTSVAVKMNGASKGTVTTSGTIDLGTVLTSHQDISGKSDTSHTHSVKINGTTKTIAASGGTAVDLGTYLTSIPIASSSTLGGIKVGSNLSIDSNGVLSGTANTTYSTFKGASASAAGTSGLVPAPASGKNTSFLRGDGTWVVPTDTNTTYSAGTGISLSGTTFSNSGVRSISTGTTNGTISVNTGGTTGNVAVKGLGSAAYTASSAYATASHTHSYLPLSGGAMSGSIHSIFTSNLWVNSLTNSVITLDHAGYSGWICGPTKDGRISISTYADSTGGDNKLYFGWGETGRTENSFASQMWWNGASNVLCAGTFINTNGTEVSYSGHTHSVKINGTTKTIAASGGTAVDLGTYLTAHQDISGKQDKSTAVTHTASTAVGSSTQPVYIASDGTATAIGYTIAKSVPSNAVFTDTNTHYASSTIVSNAATGTANASTSISNGKVYLNHIENGAVKSSHLIKGSGATTVTANSSNQIIISSTNTNTTYSANGLNKLSGTTMYGNGVIPAIFMSPIAAVNLCLCEHLIKMINYGVIEAAYGDTLCTDLYLYMEPISDNGGTGAIKAINSTSSTALANQLQTITNRLNSLYGDGAIRPRTFTIHFYLYSASTNTQRIPVLIGYNDASETTALLFTTIAEWLPGYYQIKFMYSDSRTAYFVNTKGSLESGGCLGAESPSRLWQIHISRFM